MVTMKDSHKENVGGSLLPIFRLLPLPWILLCLVSLLMALQKQDADLNFKRMNQRQSKEQGKSSLLLKGEWWDRTQACKGDETFRSTLRYWLGEAGDGERAMQKMSITLDLKSNKSAHNFRGAAELGSRLHSHHRANYSAAKTMVNIKGLASEILLLSLKPE